MQVVTITALTPLGSAVTAVATTFEQAVVRINKKFAQIVYGTAWVYLPLPDGDASFSRSTILGNVTFLVERHEL